MQISIPICILDKKSKFFKFKMADGRHIENVFGYISPISVQYWPIYAKFGPEIKNHMPIQDTDQNCNFRKFKTADGRHFENRFISICHL